MRVQSERYPQLILHALSKCLIESDAMMKLSMIDVLWRTTPAVVFLSRSSWLSTSWMAKGDGVQKTLDRQSVWFPWYYIFPLFPCFFFHKGRMKFSGRWPKNDSPWWVSTLFVQSKTVPLFSWPIDLLIKVLFQTEGRRHSALFPYCKTFAGRPI